MKLATWNVNSLKIRLPQVLEWLAANVPDVLCLQETKIEDDKFPTVEITAAGYHPAYVGQKTYNGVAILSRALPEQVSTGIEGYNDPQKRVLAATIAGVRVISVYVPNGESVSSEKYRYKLDWLARLAAWLKAELVNYPQLALLGDFNIAPEERDVHDPRLWEGRVLFSAPERAALAGVFECGLKDSFRLFDQPDKSFTWWDYRLNAFKRNMGFRIDHILFSPHLARKCQSCMIDRSMRSYDRPSDHAPVVAEITI